MKTPTLEEVKNADHEQVCKWWRFLPIGEYPKGEAGELLKKKFFDGGGFTPELSKKIGWEK